MSCVVRWDSERRRGDAARGRHALCRSGLEGPATWDIIKETYLAFTHRLEDMCYETPGLSDKERRRAAFWFRKWLERDGPEQFLLDQSGGDAEVRRQQGREPRNGIST